MKTDATRQKAYQERRREREDRISIWISKEVEQGIDVLRGDESRTAWINRAITELTIRQVLGKPFPFKDEEHAQAVRLGRERGIPLPE